MVLNKKGTASAVPSFCAHCASAAPAIQVTPHKASEQLAYLLVGSSGRSRLTLFASGPLRRLLLARRIRADRCPSRGALRFGASRRPLHSRPGRGVIAP